MDKKLEYAAARTPFDNFDVERVKSLFAVISQTGLTPIADPERLLGTDCFMGFHYWQIPIPELSVLNSYFEFPQTSWISNRLASFRFQYFDVDSHEQYLSRLKALLLECLDSQLMTVVCNFGGVSDNQSGAYPIRYSISQYFNRKLSAIANSISLALMCHNSNAANFHNEILNAIVSIDLDSDLDISFSDSSKDSAQLVFGKKNIKDDKIHVFQRSGEFHHLRISKSFPTLKEAVMKFEKMYCPTGLRCQLLEHFCTVLEKNEFDRSAKNWNNLYPYSDFIFSGMYKDSPMQLLNDSLGRPPENAVPITILGFENNDYQEIYLDLINYGPQTYFEVRSNAGRDFLRNALGSIVGEFEFWEEEFVNRWEK